MVRTHAAKGHQKKKDKHRRSGSAIQLRPLKSSQSSKKNMRAVQSQQDLDDGHQTTENQENDEDYVVDEL